jgi:hypothetical protein
MTLKLKQQMAWITIQLRLLDWREDSAGPWPAASRNEVHGDEGEEWSEPVPTLPECADLRAGHYPMHSLPETSVDAVSRAKQGPFQLPSVSVTD